jgi:Fe-S-cluster containining protein
MSLKSGPKHGHGLAFPVTSCDCQHCRQACLNSPGWFMPREVDALARFLGLDQTALFQKYLAVGATHMPEGPPRHGVMPHKLRDGKKPGSVWTLPELAQPGRCIFFDRGKCTIYPVRPYECARMIHNRRDEAVRLRRQIVKAWTNTALKPFQKLVKKHLSGSPQPPKR